MSGVDRSMQYQLFVKGIQRGTYTIEIHKDALIDDFYKLVEKKSGIPCNELRAIHVGKELVQSRGKKISDYPFIQNESTLFLVMRLKGGSETENVVFEKQLDNAVELTSEPDMITWDDDPLGQRAKMPCGHAISPESLTAYCRSLLTAGKFQFLCPYIDPVNSARCNQEWTYIEVRRYGVLTAEEQKMFETKISENYLHKAMGIQECPGCGSLCERHNTKDKRVICRVCTSEKKSTYEFCWNCLHEWRSSGTQDCGNEECGGEDPRLRTLRDAPLKKVVGVQTRGTRACPNCGMLIEHIQACKHMSCLCGTQFCFICLKMKSGSSWSCGVFNSKCTPAPVQTSIPGC